MRSTNKTPPCLSDAPPGVMLIANHLANALFNSLAMSIAEEIPEIMDRELRDLAEGICLITAYKFQDAETRRRS